MKLYDYNVHEYQFKTILCVHEELYVRLQNVIFVQNALYGNSVLNCKYNLWTCLVRGPRSPTHAIFLQHFQRKYFLGDNLSFFKDDCIKWCVPFFVLLCNTLLAFTVRSHVTMCFRNCKYKPYRTYVTYTTKRESIRNKKLSDQSQMIDDVDVYSYNTHMLCTYVYARTQKRGTKQRHKNHWKTCCECTIMYHRTSINLQMIARETGLTLRFIYQTLASL